MKNGVVKFAYGCLAVVIAYLLVYMPYYLFARFAFKPWCMKNIPASAEAGICDDIPLAGVFVLMLMAFVAWWLLTQFTRHIKSG